MRGTRNSGDALKRKWNVLKTIIDVLIALGCAAAVIVGVTR